MSKTLILLFHPDLSHSRANVALAAAAAKLPAVEVVDMHAIYPDGIDISSAGKREGSAECCGCRLCHCPGALDGEQSWVLCETS